MKFIKWGLKWFFLAVWGAWWLLGMAWGVWVEKEIGMEELAYFGFAVAGVLSWILAYKLRFGSEEE